MAKNTYKEQHKKISKKNSKNKVRLARKMVDKKKSSKLKWEELITLSRCAIEMIAKYTAYGKSLKDKHPERLEDPVTKEVYGGYFKLLNEHLTQINKIILLHSVLDKDGNPKVREDGSYIMRTGYCKDEDLTTVVTLMDQYVSEIELLEAIPYKIMLELASQFDAEGLLKKDIEEMKKEYQEEQEIEQKLKENIEENKTDKEGE